MPLRWCGSPGCSNAAERDRGDCMICSGHWCLKHVATEFHDCPSEDADLDTFFNAYGSAKERHLKALLNKVDFDALKATASRLHDNVQCTLPAVKSGSGQDGRSVDIKLVSEQMGGQNCHLDICFEDGTVWIARLRLQEPTLPPSEAQEKIFTSEVYTLHFLAQTCVPVPIVFYHTFDQSEIGTSFVLMEKMPGRPLDWSRSAAEKKTKVMEQLCDIFLELEKHPLPATGSISEHGVIGPFAQTHMFLNHSQSIGPFDTLDKSLNSILKHELEMIRDGELGTLPVDNYLTHLWRLEHISDLLVDAPDAHFYIKHFDDKGDHILVDEQHNITGIIDWEFASAESKPYAFSSPCMMWPVGKYYDGSNELSSEELEFAQMFRRRGREDMAQIVLRGRRFQRFLFFLGSPVSGQREEFEALFQGMRKAFEGEDIESYAEWRSAAISRESNDPVLKRLLQAEQAEVAA